MFRDGKFSYVSPTIGGHGKKNNLSQGTVKSVRQKKKGIHICGGPPGKVGVLPPSHTFLARATKPLPGVGGGRVRKEDNCFAAGGSPTLHVEFSHI